MTQERFEELCHTICRDYDIGPDTSELPIATRWVFEFVETLIADDVTTEGIKEQLGILLNDANIVGGYIAAEAFDEQLKQQRRPKGNSSRDDAG